MAYEKKDAPCEEVNTCGELSQGDTSVSTMGNHD